MVELELREEEFGASVPLELNRVGCSFLVDSSLPSFVERLC